VRRATPSPKARELGFCRCCYDHLAGQVGVAVTQALQSRGHLLSMPDKHYEITPAGVTWFGDVGLDVRAIRPTRRGLARQCLDWIERTHHVAGPLGVQFLRRLCDVGWMLRARDSRGHLLSMPDKHYEITPAGVTWFGDVGLDVRAIRPTRRGLARQCLDWIERTHHVAGPLGVQFLRRLCDVGWMLRARDSRAVLVTPKGWQ